MEVRANAMSYNRYCLSTLTKKELKFEHQKRATSHSFNPFNQKVSSSCWQKESPKRI